MRASLAAITKNWNKKYIFQCQDSTLALTQTPVLIYIMKPYTIPIAYINGKQVLTAKLYNAQQIHFEGFYKQITSVQPEFFISKKSSDT